MSVRVKVCGNTRLEDAQLAVSCGADALGFIFYPPSPRAITPEAAAAIIAALPSFAVTVGVFVNASVEYMNTTATYCRLDRIQLHGDEPHAQIGALVRPAYRARKLRDEAALERLLSEPDETVLLDTYDATLQGGTGRVFNWEWARQAGNLKRVILAGGLNAANIAQAITVARPWAVDISSSLESRPGVKCPDKVAQLFQALRQVQTGHSTPQPKSDG